MKKLFTFLLITSFYWFSVYNQMAWAAVTTDNIKYGTSTSMTCTGASTLASSQTAAVSCAQIDNTTNLGMDAYVVVTATTGSGSPANDKTIYIYVYGGDNAATVNYEQDESSSPALGGNYTLNNPTQFRQATAIVVVTASKQYNREFSVASMFGGVLPPHWGLIIENFSGQTLAGFTASYSLVTYTNQ